MNIFLGLYACEPYKGSEPEVGWQMVNEIAKVMPDDNIYAITKSNNKELIEKEVYPKNITFFYYSPPKWLVFWKKGERGIRTYYYIWLIGASLFMRKQNLKFDIVHHITFVNDWLPSFFYLLKTKKNKFIWGSIGSNDPVDFKFYNNKKMKLKEVITNLLKFSFRNLDPFFYICKLKADMIIGINDNVRKKLHLKNTKYFISESAIAIKKDEIKDVNFTKKENNNFIIISVGRLVYIKNFKLTILAFAYFLKNNPNILNTKLQIIGEGKDRDSLITYAKNLKINNKIEFLGQMERDTVQEHFSKANLFLFPTLENAGFVTLEAMSNALPVVAMNYGGPKQFIKKNITSQLVDATEPYDVIAHNLSKRVELFYQNKELCLEVGIKNREEILQNFTWEAKAQKMKKIYKELLNET